MTEGPLPHTALLRAGHPSWTREDGGPLYYFHELADN